ncbi:MAG: ankyrin repeat domain-containing protein [Gemmatimonadota bacterium]|nr:MAG: ankyrin repeat domain-containing protein [Gemmatimonadota bacterium]
MSAANDGGHTPLMGAALFGHTEVGSLLLKHGADVNAKAVDGATALSLAEQAGHTEVANLLREHGAR